MSDAGSHTPWKPSMTIYVAAIVVGTTVATVAAAIVFATSTIATAASMGAILAVIGALMNENTGDAIVLSVILGVMCGLLLWLGSDPVADWVGTWVVPAVLGFCSSAVLVGLSRELGA